VCWKKKRKTNTEKGKLRTRVLVLYSVYINLTLHVKEGGRGGGVQK
jgi:hypothetical protein